MHKTILRLFAVAVVILGVCGSAIAAPFSSPDNLVVIRCTAGLYGGAERIFLDEYDVSGDAPVLRQTIGMPSTGLDAVAMSPFPSHERHLHRSVDGRFLTFAGYSKQYVANSYEDPSAEAAATTPRVVGILKYDGTYDLSTKLTDAYDWTAFRSAVTTDGTKLWLAGDNASGATDTGGTRFTTKGSSTTVNLSQVQTIGGAKTTDNIREVNIFNGQLYNSSGSSSSVGKAIFQVGTGLPESGSQLLTTLTTDGASTCTFYFVDADRTVPGLDTLYSGSSIGNTLRKYNLVGGVWTPKGMLIGSTEVDQVTVKIKDNGEAVIYALQYGSVYRITDGSPYGGSLTGGFGSAYISASQGHSLGGFDFAPGRVPCDFDDDGDVDNDDHDLFESCASGPGIPRSSSPLCQATDLDRDNDVDQVDFGVFQRCYNGADGPVDLHCAD
jgi:hypothetical protein